MEKSQNKALFKGSVNDFVKTAETKISENNIRNERIKVGFSTYFKEKQLKLIGALDALADEGGNMEKIAILKALKPLRQDIFDLSYSPANKEAIMLEKRLCKAVNFKYNETDQRCVMGDDD